jgi:phospholipid-binding lipoprotein MlaA
MVRLRALVPLLLAAGLLSGCATATPEAIAANDPLEPANRVFYDFDRKLDKYVELPVAWVYVFYLPAPIHHGLHNFFINLNSPITFVNDVLQGEFGRAGTTFGRFTLNSTLGLGGFVDLATPAGFAPYREADFGETLGHYGIGEGPFLVLPFVGPEPPRDLFGDAVDAAMDPLLYLPPAAPLAIRAPVTVATRTAGALEDDARNIILRQELERGSVDPYVTMRSIYRQLREEQIGMGVPDEGDPK